MRASFKAKIAGVAVAALAFGGMAAMAAPSANATTFNCVFSNGCGALHGVNAVGTPVAVDAKYKNPAEEAIGYPDLSGDSATNVALVAHQSKSFGTLADTAVQAFLTHRTATDCPAQVTNFTSSNPSTATPAAGTTFSHASATGVASAVISSGNLVVTVTGTGNGSVTVSNTSANGDCTVVDSVALMASSGNVTSQVESQDVITSVTSANNNVTGSVTFNANSSPAIAATESNLPPGLVSGQPLTPGSATPGTYNDLGLTVTDAQGASVTGTFDLKVTGHHVAVSGPVFYTIVFAKNGFWSSDCLTAVGAGKLRFSPCTLGHNPAQRFYAFSGSVPVTANILGGGTYSFRNAAFGFMEDASQNTSPLTPQNDLADSILPGGRQLDVNGTGPIQANELWIWGP